MSETISVDPLNGSQRTELLLKEAYSLSVEIAAMNKQIDASVRQINGDFAVALERYFEEDGVANHLGDKARDKGIEEALGYVFFRLAKVFKLAHHEIPFLGEVIDIFTSDKNPPLRAAFLDAPGDPRLLQYESKKARLAALIREFSKSPNVPVRVNLNNVCRYEACWQSR